MGAASDIAKEAFSWISKHVRLTSLAFTTAILGFLVFLTGHSAEFPFLNWVVFAACAVAITVPISWAAGQVAIQKRRRVIRHYMKNLPPDEAKIINDLKARKMQSLVIDGQLIPTANHLVAVGILVLDGGYVRGQLKSYWLSEDARSLL